MSSTRLTPRQRRAIQCLLESRSVEAGCAAAKISRSTYYVWTEQASFKAELDRQRAELIAQGFAVLAQTTAKAIETLAGLLDAGDNRLKRLAARDVLATYLKHKELDELTYRVEAVEARLNQQQGNHANGYDPELERLSLEELEQRLAVLKRMRPE
jgi:hypothetical protein